MKSATRRGGRFTTASTSRPLSSPVVYSSVIWALDLRCAQFAEIDPQLVSRLAGAREFFGLDHTPDTDIDAEERVDCGAG